MKIENEIEKGKIELSLCEDFTYDNGFLLFLIIVINVI